MIEPVSYIRSVDGKSKGHIITFSDHQDYVVKFVRRGFEKVLPNEWIAYCLARFMNIPIPHSRIVEIPENFFHTIPDTSDVIFTRKQFASLYIPDCRNVREAANLQSVTNHETLAGIILLDYWLCNPDRNRNNLLLREENEGSYQLWMIDQGDSFGSCNWTMDELENLSTELYRSATHKLMSRFVETEGTFSQYLNVLRTIPRLLLEEIVGMIPEEWPISPEEREAVVHKLMVRRDKQLEFLMHQFIKKIYRLERKQSRSRVGAPNALATGTFTHW